MTIADDTTDSIEAATVDAVREAIWSPAADDPDWTHVSLPTRAWDRILHTTRSDSRPAGGGDVPTPGEWAAHQAFHRLTVRERDLARTQTDRLRTQVQALENELTALREGTSDA